MKLWPVQQSESSHYKISYIWLPLINIPKTIQFIEIKGQYKVFESLRVFRIYIYKICQYLQRDCKILNIVFASGSRAKFVQESSAKTPRYFSKSVLICSDLVKSFRIFVSHARGVLSIAACFYRGSPKFCRGGLTIFKGSWDFSESGFLFWERTTIFLSVARFGEEFFRIYSEFSGANAIYRAVHWWGVTSEYLENLRLIKLFNEFSNGFFVPIVLLRSLADFSYSGKDQS